MKTKNLVLGIVGGIAAGAVLGVLFAPDKGVSTRRKIAQKGSDLKESIKSSFNDFLSNFEDKYEDVSSRAAKKIEKSAEKLDQIKN